MTPVSVEVTAGSEKPRFSSRAFSSNAFIAHQVDFECLQEPSMQCVDLPRTLTSAHLATRASLYLHQSITVHISFMYETIEKNTKRSSVRLREAEIEMHALSVFCAVRLLTNGCSVSRVPSLVFLDDILVFVIAMLPGIISCPMVLPLLSGFS